MLQSTPKSSEFLPTSVKEANFWTVFGRGNKKCINFFRGHDGFKKNHGKFGKFEMKMDTGLSKIVDEIVFLEQTGKEASPNDFVNIKQVRGVKTNCSKLV